MRKRVFCVGGGPSLGNFPFPNLFNEDSIAVNMSIFQLPTAHSFITMDYTWLRKSKVQCGGDDSQGPAWQYFVTIPAKKYFVLAVDPTYLEKLNDKTYVDKQFGLHYNLSLFDEILPVASYGGVSQSYRDFRTGSDSGFAALQLAVLMGYQEIYLIGYDFKTKENKTHYHGVYSHSGIEQYNQKLQEFLIPYPKALAEIQGKGIKIFHCTEDGGLSGLIPYRNWRDLF